MKNGRILFALCVFSALMAQALTPDQLMCELLAKPGLVAVTDSTPEFSWCFKDGRAGDCQTAYRIQVATDTSLFKTDSPDLWDSGKVESPKSVFVPYAGGPLPGDRQICWRVKVWDRKGKEGPWSLNYAFKTAGELGDDTPLRYPLAQRHVEPARIVTNAAGRVFVDFGRAAFGWVELLPPRDMRRGGDYVLHIGEKAIGDSVDTKPGLTIRYAKVRGALTDQGIYRVPLMADKRNTSGAAVRMPPEIGVVMPFRYVEVEQCPFPVTKQTIRQIAVTYPFDNNAANFVSDNDALNRVYGFCKYSIRATTFAGVYVDGDRERIPYEADAYINQLGHYSLDREYTLARYTLEHLMRHPTWPTEWKQHSIMMAWQDWMYTGNTEALSRWYDELKQKKLLSFCARQSDGLLETKGPNTAMSDGSRDIVDWPVAERDGFEFRNVNTVINAFRIHNLRQMADIAQVLGKADDAAEFKKLAAAAYDAFQHAFYNAERGCYVDGEGAAHASIHANIMPLAFGLVPPEEVPRVAEFVRWRGMSCSVYAAQYLLEGLFEAGLEDYAIELMSRSDKRSWMNMLNAGSTITMEAWDNQYKSNQDWNHAWGAVPANIIPRFVVGVRPLTPGFGKILIRPQLGSLNVVEGFVPTVRGRVTVSVRQSKAAYKLAFTIPYNTTARVEIPAWHGGTLKLDGKKIRPELVGNRWVLDNVESGSHTVTFNVL